MITLEAYLSNTRMRIALAGGVIRTEWGWEEDVPESYYRKNEFTEGLEWGWESARRGAEMMRLDDPIIMKQYNVYKRIGYKRGRRLYEQSVMEGINKG